MRGRERGSNANARRCSAEAVVSYSCTSSVTILHRFTGTSRLKSLILFVSPLSVKASLCTTPICQGFYGRNCAGVDPQEISCTFLKANSGQCQRFARCDGQVLRFLILGAGHRTPRPERYPQYRLAKTDTWYVTSDQCSLYVGAWPPPPPLHVSPVAPAPSVARSVSAIAFLSADQR
jgi:hypothetical protein